MTGQGNNPPLAADNGLVLPVGAFLSDQLEAVLKQQLLHITKFHGWAGPRLGWPSPQRL